MSHFMKNMKVMAKAIRMETHEHKQSYIVFLALRLIILAMMIFEFVRGNYEGGVYCIFALILLFAPSLFQVNFKVELPTVLEIVLLIFIFAGTILGELQNYYAKIPIWDTALHTVNGFIMAAIGFALVDILNTNKDNFNLSPMFMAIVAFCFSMTIGVVWEFFEYFMDTFFALDMQKDTVIHTIKSIALDETNSNTPVIIDSITNVAVNGQVLNIDGYLDIGLKDTMKDLIVNFIGAVVFSIFGFFYIKNRGQGRIAKRFIPKTKAEDADFLEKAKELENSKSK